VRQWSCAGSGAPRQGWEGAPNARLEIDPAFVQGLDGIQSGQDIWILTWLHESQRSAPSDSSDHRYQAGSRTQTRFLKTDTRKQ